MIGNTLNFIDVIVICSSLNCFLVAFPVLYLTAQSGISSVIYQDLVKIAVS